MGGGGGVVKSVGSHVNFHEVSIGLPLILTFQ